MEAMWMRYCPVFDKLESLIKDKTIGDVKYVHCQFGFAINDDTNPRLFKSELGGGALLDIGVYIVTLIYAVFGNKMPTKIVSHADIVNNEYDFQTSAIFGFPNGHATMNCGFGADYRNEATITGTKGTIRVTDPFWCSDCIILELNGKDPEMIRYPLPQSEKKFNFRNSIGLFYEAKYLQECLLKHKLDSEKHSIHDTLQVMHIMDTIRHQIGLKYPLYE